MSPSVRLRLVAVVLLMSAVYAVMVAKDPQVASAISSGYVAIVVTVIVLVNVWKKP